jgi:hypothetical protein
VRLFNTDVYAITAIYGLQVLPLEPLGLVNTFNFVLFAHRLNSLSGTEQGTRFCLSVVTLRNQLQTENMRQFCGLGSRNKRTNTCTHQKIQHRKADDSFVGENIKCKNSGFSHSAVEALTILVCFIV